MDRIEIAVRIIERTIAMVVSNGLNINIDTLVNDAFDVADKVVGRDKATADTYPSWANWIAQDAERYRWMRKHVTDAHGNYRDVNEHLQSFDFDCEGDVGLDDAIDAALARAQGVR